MRIIFAGTPGFAVTVLEALLETDDLTVAGVISQPARPRGRGLEAPPTPVMALAAERKLALLTPPRWDDEATAFAREAAADVLVTAACGFLLPPAALSACRLGAVNVHASLLPRWRGASPIQRAIAAGDAETGVSIFLIEEKLDTGPVLARQAMKIDARETAADLHDRLALLAASLLPPTLRAWEAGVITPQPQDDSLATRAPKLRKEEGRLTWERPAEEIDRLARAFHPWPGVSIGDLKLIACAPAAESGRPGEVLSLAPCLVACGRGAVRLDRVQKPGGKAMSGEAYARGARLQIGRILGNEQ